VAPITAIRRNRIDEDSFLDLERERTLRQLKTPATCLVPRTRHEVTSADRLLSTIKSHRDGIGAFLVMYFGVAFMVGGTTTGVTAEDGTFASGFALPLVCGLISSLILGYGVFAIGHGQYKNANALARFIANLRVSHLQRRDMRRATREAGRLDSKVGWRPREGIPHPTGRDDTHDRYLVEVHATELGLALVLRRWRCDGRVTWHPAELVTVTWIDGADEVELAECRAKLEETIPLLEKQSQDKLTTGRAEQEFLHDQMRPRRELAEHVNGQVIAQL